MNTTMTKQVRAMLICGVATLGYGAAAVAGCPDVQAVKDGAPTQTVRFADLDLSRPDGVEALYRRLQSAARIVCQRQSRYPEMRSPPFDKACITKAIAEAVSCVNRPLLTEYHQSRVGAEQPRPALTAKAQR